MKVEARNYGKIVVLSVSGPVTQADLISLTVEIPETCKEATHVVLLLDQAKLDASVPKQLIAWRDKQAALHPKIGLVAANFDGADAKNLVEALDVVNTSDADRLIQVFARDHELTRLRDKKAEADKQVEQLLALPAKHLQADFETAALKLRERHRAAKARLHRLTGAQLPGGEQVEVVTGAEDRIQKLKTRALTLLKKE
ncbi:MAG: hypothetical protein HY074_01170 [Deltaproteobacteria bacterium]|nr:hypothetical protein [Deltaproteobacteria bacterium]